MGMPGRNHDYIWGTVRFACPQHTDPDGSIDGDTQQLAPGTDGDATGIDHGAETNDYIEEFGHGYNIYTQSKKRIPSRLCVYFLC